MKFIEMNTLQACAAMESISQSVSHLLSHETIKKAMADIRTASRPVDALNFLIPVLVGPCLDDTVQVLSVMIGKDVETIKKQPILQTVADIRELVKDLNGVDVA